MTPRGSETFFNLLSVLGENRKERAKMLSILKLDPTRRKIAVNILVTEMRLKQAPIEFIEAWDALQDDGLAEDAKRIIEEQNQGEGPGIAAMVFAFVFMLVVIGFMLLFLRFLSW